MPRVVCGSLVARALPAEGRAGRTSSRTERAGSSPRNRARRAGSRSGGTGDAVSRDAIRLALAPCKAMFATAFEDGAIRSNPTAVRNLIPASASGGDEKGRAVTEGELARLLVALPEEWRLFFTFLAQTGLRIGEAIEVRWGDVDLGGRWLDVQRRFYRGGVALPKGRKTRRVRLSEGMARSLWALRKTTRVGMRISSSRPRRAGRIDQSNLMSRVLKPRGAVGRCRVGWIPRVQAHVRDDPFPLRLERRAGAAVPRALRSWLHSAAVRAPARRGSPGPALCVWRAQSYYYFRMGPKLSATNEPEGPDSTQELVETETYTAGEQQASLASRVFDQLRLAGLARAMIFVVGAATLLYGLVNAWRAENVTTLVVVGSALLVTALIFPRDWSEVGLTWGEASAVIRRVENVLEKASEASGSESDLEWRQEIEQLRGELNAIKPAPRRRSGTETVSNEAFEEMFRTRASHSFRGTDAVVLTLRAPAGRGQRYRCYVTRPDGTLHIADPWRPFMVTVMPTTPHSVTYPDEFDGAGPLTPGKYEVAWRSASKTARESLVAVLGGMSSPPVATDSFTMPDLVATNWQREQTRLPET